MFAPAMIVAQAKITEMQAEAAAQRLAKQNRSARGTSRGRLTVALSNVRSFLSVEGPSALPTLTDYPSRG